MLPKKIIYSLLLAGMAFSLTNCTVSHHHHHHHKTKKVPPGHAKKMSGDKSAKKHAHGHNK
ncbi:hypothetical protein [Flavobacterium limnosediminis]|nr:hypothetical protein [Flavobacterium limnosediminis]